ncbi:hypothetical protein skT53_34040 [Effusibacillus dendaii]|uniref:Transcriptional regulator n=1 Tax=Effusibacillus dendaii TaxID=2743772 RepID=A0A7I8DHC8_9BACL|nr:hypothetical protein skT53_34040 [Effusibacillus dendaii]
MKKISRRFSIAVHIMSLIATSKDTPCTSEWIAESVNTNPVIIRKIIGKLKKAGLVNVRPGYGGHTSNRDWKKSLCLTFIRL